MVFGSFLSSLVVLEFGLVWFLEKCYGNYLGECYVFESPFEETFYEDICVRLERTLFLNMFFNYSSQVCLGVLAEGSCLFDTLGGHRGMRPVFGEA